MISKLEVARLGLGSARLEVARLGLESARGNASIGSTEFALDSVLEVLDFLLTREAEREAERETDREEA